MIRPRLLVAALVLLAACGSDDEPDGAAAPTSTIVDTTSTSEPDVMFTPDDAEARVTLPPTTPTTATIPTTTTTTTIVPPTTTTIPPTTTTTTTTTISAPDSAEADVPGDELAANEVFVGSSIEGRPIIAERFGTEGGRRVLVVGVIHGNEDAGVAVIDELRARAAADGVPDTVELWLIESMNPDGQSAQIRQNANGVDLNRNFPHEWGPIGQPGDSQYAGSGPASEPETQAMVAFIELLRPDIALWYHQDANLIIPSTGRQGRVRARYAELTGLPLAECCSGGGIYTGIAATWARVTLADQEAVPFIVELPGGDLTSEQVTAHADAVLTIAAEG